MYNDTRKAWQPYYDSITIGEITTAEEAFKKIDNAHPDKYRVIQRTESVALVVREVE